MNRKLWLYRTTVIALALTSAIGLYLRSPRVTPEQLFAILLLSILAIVAELLGFVLPNSARGSIAFIPYLACALVVPTWATVAAVAVVRALFEATHRSRISSTLLNVGLHALTVSGAIWIYGLFGGQGLLSMRSATLLQATLSTSLAALVSIASAILANTMAACGYLAIREGQTLQSLWRKTALPTIAIDFVAAPIVFIFAWLYAAHGAIAAAALWVPLLGLREVQTANLALQRTNEELLQLMIKSIEARDLYTSGHSRRVQRYSIIIARGLKLSGREIETIGKAALLHDVG